MLGPHKFGIIPPHGQNNLPKKHRRDVIQLLHGLNQGIAGLIDTLIFLYSCAVRLASVLDSFVHDPASWQIARSGKAGGSQVDS